MEKKKRNSYIIWVQKPEERLLGTRHKQWHNIKMNLKI
jgi:hypothetical protein